MHTCLYIRAFVIVVLGVFVILFCLLVLIFVVSTSATDCLGKPVSEVTCNSRLKLYSLIHSLSLSVCMAVVVKIGFADFFSVCALKRG